MYEFDILYVPYVCVKFIKSRFFHLFVGQDDRGHDLGWTKVRHQPHYQHQTLHGKYSKNSHISLTCNQDIIHTLSFYLLFYTKGRLFLYELEFEMQIFLVVDVSSG